MPLLFQKFAPIVGQQMTRPHDAGLGLVFCRMAMELHGGTIEAQSEPVKGTFRIALPLPAAKQRGFRPEDRNGPTSRPVSYAGRSRLPLPTTIDYRRSVSSAFCGDPAHESARAGDRRAGAHDRRTSE